MKLLVRIFKGLLLLIPAVILGTYFIVNQLRVSGWFCLPLPSSFSTPQVATLKRLISDDNTYVMPDGDLGWTIRPNATGDGLLYASNSQGLRANRIFSKHPAKGFTRIAVFGGSHVHGDAVALEATWPELLEKRTKSTEIVNYGVPAYGLDQAYLRYRKERPFSNYVVIGFTTDSILRNLNAFRPFYFGKTGVPLAKPRFVLEGDALKLVPNPLPTSQDYLRFVANVSDGIEELRKNEKYFNDLYQESAWAFAPFISNFHKTLWQLLHGYLWTWDWAYQPQGEPMKILRKIFDAFYLDIQKNGATPVIFLITPTYAIKDYQRTNRKNYQPLLDYLHERQFRYIDSTEIIAKSGYKLSKEDLELATHYSANLNAVIAEGLARVF